jgi:hypothetical protein
MQEQGPLVGLKSNTRTSVFLANYAVAMGLLRQDLSWDAYAHVLNRLTSDVSLLNERARIPFLKYYLLADGGLLTAFAAEVSREGQLQLSKFLNDRGVERAFSSAAEQYLNRKLDTSERAEVRKLERPTEKPYTPGVRRHKSLPHLEPLVDLEILSHGEGVNGSTYVPRVVVTDDQRHNRLEKFLEQFSDLSETAFSISSDGDFFARAARVYGIHNDRLDPISDFELLRRQILVAYNEVKNPSFKLAHIEAIADLSCTRLLTSENHLLVEWHDVRKALDRMRIENEGEVRLHLDDWGKEAFVVISEKYSAAFS